MEDEADRAFFGRRFLRRHDSRSQEPPQRRAELRAGRRRTLRTNDLVRPARESRDLHGDLRADADRLRRAAGSDVSKELVDRFVVDQLDVEMALERVAERLASMRERARVPALDRDGRRLDRRAESDEVVVPEVFQTRLSFSRIGSSLS